MVLGRAGLRLVSVNILLVVKLILFFCPHLMSTTLRLPLSQEAQKFALYLLVPITATLAFNEPSVQKWAADYFQFMKYPSNPKTNLKDEFESIKRQREEEIEYEKKMEEKRARGREEYVNQLKQLNLARGGGDVVTNNSAESTQGRGWFGWLRGWRRGNDGGDGKAASDR